MLVLPERAVFARKRAAGPPSHKAQSRNHVLTLNGGAAGSTIFAEK
jgi:hypothetical protein